MISDLIKTASSYFIKIFYLLAWLIPLPTFLKDKISRYFRQELFLPLTKCENLEAGTGSGHLIDVDRVILESITIIDQQLEKQPDKAGFIRRDPLVFSCLSRGGKTTVLRELFDKLKKKKKYSTMIVSFNVACGFIRKPAERPEDSLLRHIVSQLIDQTAVTEDELLHFQYSEELFERYLDEQTGYGTSSAVPFIMLIDELNVLGAPLSSLASKLLQRLFLRKNRYLVFTTHVPFNLSNEEAVSPIDKKRVMSGSSSCDMKVVRMPQCNDLAELRLMQGCEGLTGHEATIYGGIPGLIYSASQNIDFALNKFTYAMKLFEQLFPNETI